MSTRPRKIQRITAPSPLKAIFESMHFKRKLIDMALSVAANPNTKNQFYSNMSKHLDLIIQISQDQLVHHQVLEKIKQLKISLKATFEEAGVLPNTGEIPNPEWTVLQILNYATDEEVKNQTELDKETGNLSFPNSACTRIIGKIFSSHFHRKSGIEERPSSFPSIGIFDICCSSYQSNAGSKHRTKKNVEDINGAIKALGISPEAYYLPFMVQITMTALLHQNSTGEPMPVFGCTSRLMKVFNCSEDINLDIGSSSDPINILGRVIHPEVALRACQGWMHHYSKEDVKKMDGVMM